MNSEISCVVCHTKILLNPQVHSEDRNYATCENGHYLHIDPCLKMCLLSSELCPVCNSNYPTDIVEIYSKKSQIETILPPEESHSEQLIEECMVVIDKLSRAKKLLLEQKFAASLNIIFDVLDHDDPDNAEANFLLGKVYFLSGRFDLSVATLMRLLKKHYDYPLAFYYLGKNFESLGLDDKALWAYERSYMNIKQLMAEESRDALNKSKLANILAEVIYILEKLRLEQTS